MENYAAAYKSVAVTSEEPVKIQETLAPLSKGIVEIISNPPGAKIVLNDQETDLVTPIRVENLEIQKTYNVKLTYPSYQDWTGSVDLKGFDPMRLEAALTPLAPVAPPVTAALTPPVTTPTSPVPQPPTELRSPEPTYGKLSVTSDTSGARILLNGGSTGRVTAAP